MSLEIFTSIAEVMGGFHGSHWKPWKQFRGSHGSHCIGRWQTFSFNCEMVLIKFSNFFQKIEAAQKINLFKSTVELLH